jgi:hypothetical protein
VPALEQWFEADKSKADFRIVYVAEAHPSDGWAVRQNQQAGIDIKTPRSDEERHRAAAKCAAEMKISIPIVVDGIDDAVEKAYAGWPDRLYVIDKAGKIAYKGRPGPAGFRPAEARQALRKLNQ